MTVSVFSQNIPKFVPAYKMDEIEDNEDDIDGSILELENFSSNYNIIEIDTSIDYEHEITEIYDKIIKNEGCDDDYIREKYLPNYIETNELENISVVYNAGYRKSSTQALLDNLYQNYIKGIEMDFDYISIKENKNIYILYNEDKDEKINLDEINDIKYIKFKEEYKKVNNIQIELAEFLIKNGFKNQNDLKNFVKKNNKNQNFSSKNKFIKLKMQIGMHEIKMKSLDVSILSFKYKKTKYKFYKNIKNFHILYNSIKEENNKLLNKIDSVIKEFEEEYIDGCIKCNFKNCNEQCHGDVGYCLTHYPAICSNCDKILAKDEKLSNNNKKYGIENCCYSCSYSKYFDYFVKNYKINDFLYIFDEKDELYNTKKAIVQKNYYEIEQDMLILDDIKDRNDLLKKEIIELYGYTFDENSEFNKYNDYTKYKLYNRLTRSKDILTEFGEKLKNIKIKPSFYAYMGKQEYSAFKNFLKGLLELKNLNDNLPTEPPSDYDDEE